jgi:hypothetical protein
VSVYRRSGPSRRSSRVEAQHLGTVVRPPRLSSKPGTGNYRTAYGQNVRGGWIVPRADVAHLMLGALGRPETIKQVIGVAS